MSSDVRRRLDEAGGRPVPPPHPAFADSLDDRLRAVAGSLPRGSGTPPRRRRAMAGRWALAAGLSAAVVLGALGLSLARDDQQAGLALASPVNVEVVLVNGTILEDPDGLLLPEGAVVRVGDMGSARIGDTAHREGSAVRGAGPDGTDP